MKMRDARQCLRKASDLLDLMDGADWATGEGDEVIAALPEREQAQAHELFRRLWIRIDQEIS